MTPPRKQITSESTLCERSEDACSGNNIRYHLRTKLDPDTVKSVGNTLLREYTLEMLPEQVEIVVDFHLRPYYGDRDETEDLYYSEAKRGTTAFHAYATLRRSSIHRDRLVATTANASESKQRTAFRSRR